MSATTTRLADLRNRLQTQQAAVPPTALKMEEKLTEAQRLQLGRIDTLIKDVEKQEQSNLHLYTVLSWITYLAALLSSLAGSAFVGQLASNSNWGKVFNTFVGLIPFVHAAIKFMDLEAKQSAADTTAKMCTNWVFRLKGCKARLTDIANGVAVGATGESWDRILAYVKHLTAVSKALNLGQPFLNLLEQVEADELALQKQQGIVGAQ